MAANKGIQIRANDQIVISIYKNICEEFVNYRGLVISDPIMDNKTLSEEIFKKGYVIIKCKINSDKYEDNKEQKNLYIVLYHFLTSDNLKAVDIKKVIQLTQNIENKSKKWSSHDIILITQNTVSTHISNFIREHQSKEKLQSAGKCLFDHGEKYCNCGRNNIFAYTYANFIITIPKHVLVPEYKVLSVDEKTNVLRQLYISNTGSKLPKIKKSDPCVIWSRAVPGDVIEFIRNDEVTGKSIYYRLVI